MEESSPDTKPFDLHETNSSQPQVIRSSFDPTDAYYDMRRKKLLFVFNHYQFDKTIYFDYIQYSKRDGTFADVSRLTDVFRSLDFEVNTYNDLLYDDFFSTIKTNIIDIDHTNTSCICIAILTHGKEGGELCARDRPYDLKDVTCAMEDPKLVTIPKLFFVQACRGVQTDEGTQVEYDGAPPNVVHLPTHIDFLIIRSTVEGYASYRAGSGSWMIQTLCDILSEHHEEYDILQMVTMMNRKIALNCVTNSLEKRYHMKKQTVETRFTLIKFLKF